MFGFKRSTKAVQAPAKPVVDRHEVAYAHSWNFTYRAWLSLTEAERKDYRDRVVYAPNVQTAGN